MQTRRLGKSDIYVTEIALGCWAMGGDYWGKADDQNSIEAIHKALESGVNFFDTAELYGWGKAEEILGKGLKGKRHDVYISTKVAKQHMKKADVKKACDDSLKRLQTDYIDVYFIHYPSEEVPLEETMEGMLELKEEGKIRVIGVSNFSRGQMENAFKMGRFEVIQPCYNLLWRFIEEDIIPYCLEENISVVAYSPLAQGILTGKFREGDTFSEDDGRQRAPLFEPGRFEKCISVANSLKPIAAEYGKTQGQAAINWLISQKCVASAIVGARNAAQAEENCGAGGWRLREDDLNAIDIIGRRVTDELPRFKSFFKKII